MKELFKKWLEKLACRHEWTILAKLAILIVTDTY